MDLLRSAPQAPRGDAHCERVIGTIRREVLDHLLIVNQAPARQAFAEYREHCNTHRPHRSRDRRPPEARKQPAVGHDRGGSRAGNWIPCDSCPVTVATLMVRMSTLATSLGLSRPGGTGRP
ncbi:integrase core domain-containing protein [Streptomyces sp. NPDC127091]|uniref:integrase core domain-containing protein n=1 Tax=Streptomyces sp. NPDC127091 TaxID=3347134 RepID=UPI0036460F4D